MHTMAPCTLATRAALRLFKPSYRTSYHAVANRHASSSSSSSTTTMTPRTITRQEVYEQPDTKLNIVYDEHSKTGGDDLVADQIIAAYSREHMTPEAAKERAGRGIEINPLEISPASREVSFIVEETLGHDEVPRLKSERGGAVKARIIKITEPAPMPKGKDDKEYNKLYREVHKETTKKE